jgi:hypothetical protein
LDGKSAHRATIRAVIQRMAAGSLVVRGWALLIVGALLAVSTNPIHARFAWLAVFMAICFWTVDACFVRQAQLFRKFDRRAAQLGEREMDFSLDTSVVATEADALGVVMFERTPGAFYGAVILLTAAARLWLSFRV